jgi:hypothetical protein
VNIFLAILFVAAVLCAAYAATGARWTMAAVLCGVALALLFVLGRDDAEERR